MTKTWVSGSKGAEVVERLQKELSELEARRDELVRANSKKLIEWADAVFNSRNKPKSVDETSITEEVVRCHLIRRA